MWARYGVGRNLGGQLYVIDTFIVYMRPPRPYKTIFIGKSLVNHWANHWQIIDVCTVESIIDIRAIASSIDIRVIASSIDKNNANVGATVPALSLRCPELAEGPKGRIYTNYCTIMYDWHPKLRPTSYLAPIATPNAQTQCPIQWQ